MQLPGICSGRKSDQYNSVEGEAYFTGKGRHTMFDLGLTVTDKVSTYLLQRHERGQHHLLLDFLDELQRDLETVHLSYLRSYDEIVRLLRNEAVPLTEVRRQMDHLNVELSRLRQEIEAVMSALHQHSNLPRDAQDFLEEIMWYFLPTAGPETSVQRPQSGTTTLWETVNRIRHVSLRNLAVVRRYEAEVIYGLAQETASEWEEVMRDHSRLRRSLMH